MSQLPSFPPLSPKCNSVEPNMLTQLITKNTTSGEQANQNLLQQQQHQEQTQKAKTKTRFSVRRTVYAGLKKCRAFFKRVVHERARRSSSASGHSSLTLRNAQDDAQIREEQQMTTSSFQAGYGGRMSAQTANNFGSAGFSSSGASSLNNICTSCWKPRFTSGYENMGAIDRSYSTYVGEPVGIGQTSHNDNVLNGGYGLLNWTGNEVMTAGLMRNAAFGYLAPGESSSSAFDNANYQFPPAFSGANEETNPLVLSPLSQQQYGLGNNAQHYFTSNLMNKASVFGNIAHPAQQFGDGSNMNYLLFDPTDFQLPYQQQGGESGLNPNFPNSSYQAELNLPTNQPQNPDLSIAYGVEENAPSYEPSLEQLQPQEIAQVENRDLVFYHPNSDQNPNQQQGEENFINSELNGLDQLKNSLSVNRAGLDGRVHRLLGPR